jgi:hypothetical protein
MTDSILLQIVNKIVIRQVTTYCQMSRDFMRCFHSGKIALQVNTFYSVYYTITIRLESIYGMLIFYYKSILMSIYNFVGFILLV